MGCNASRSRAKQPKQNGKTDSLGLGGYPSNPRKLAYRPSADPKSEASNGKK
jgi:hypothetical protein